MVIKSWIWIDSTVICTSHWKTSLADLENNVMLLGGKCSYYMQSWRGRSNWGSYFLTENWCFSFSGTQEVNFVGSAVSAATIPLQARTTQIITFGILHLSSGFWRGEGGGAVGCSQIIRSRCPFQSFLDRTLTALSPLDDVATGIGNSYFSSIQPISHPPRPRSSSTCIGYSETRLIRKLSVRVIDVPVLSGLSLENMYKIFQRRDKRNLWASHRSPITQGQTFVTLTMKRYKKCFRQLLLWLVPFYRRAVLSICVHMLQILSVNSPASFIIASLMPREVLQQAEKFSNVQWKVNASVM